MLQIQIISNGNANNEEKRYIAFEIEVVVHPVLFVVEAIFVDFHPFGIAGFFHAGAFLLNSSIWIEGGRPPQKKQWCQQYFKNICST